MANDFNNKTYEISLKDITHTLKLIEIAKEYINEQNQEQRKNLKNKLLYEGTKKEGIFKIFEFLLLHDDNHLKQNSSSMNYIAYSTRLEIYKFLFLIAIDFEYTEGIETYFAKLEEILQKSRELTSINEARSQKSWNDPTQHQNAVNKEELNDLKDEYKDYITLFDLASKTKYSQGMEICFEKLIEIAQKIGTKTINISDVRSQKSWNDPIQHQKAVDIEEKLEANARFEIIFKKLKELFKLANDNDYQQGKLQCFNKIINIFGSLDKSNKIVLNTHLKDLIGFISELNDKNLSDMIYMWAIRNYGKEYVHALWGNQTPNIQRSTP